MNTGCNMINDIDTRFIITWLHSGHLRTFAIPASPVAGCEFYTGDCEGAPERPDFRFAFCISVDLSEADLSKLAMAVRIGFGLNCGLIMRRSKQKRTGSKDRPRLLWTRGRAQGCPWLKAR